MNVLIGVEVGHQSHVFMTSYQKQALMTILTMTLSVLMSLSVNVSHVNTNLK